MRSWIERSKTTLQKIIESIKVEYSGLTVRVAFVGYRNAKDGHNRFILKPFSENLDELTAFIGTVQSGWGHGCEDVQGGLQWALQMEWDPASKKQLFMIGDMPGTGRDISACAGAWGDTHPDKHPDGLVI